jgi:uncharacterized protein YndB with AHSA1/START domain
MITESSIEIAAPAAVVWTIFTDVEHWPEWTASVERLAALDGPSIEVGHRFEIRQPRFPKLVWEVTDVAPGVAWTWRQRSFGGTTLATHELTALDGERTLVRQRIDQRGPVGVAVGLLTRRLTKRYLTLEGEGLKARSEERARQGASST